MISTTTPLLTKAQNKGGYTRLGTEKVLYPDVAGPADKVLLILDDANAKAPCSNLLGAVQLIKFSLEVVSNSWPVCNRSASEMLLSTAILSTVASYCFAMAVNVSPLHTKTHLCPVH
jgi:hypothetical protein